MGINEAIDSGEFWSSNRLVGLKPRHTDRNLRQQIRHLGGNLAQKPRAIFHWDAQVFYRCFSYKNSIFPRQFKIKNRATSPPESDEPTLSVPGQLVRIFSNR